MSTLLWYGLCTVGVSSQHVSIEREEDEQRIRDEKEPTKRTPKRKPRKALEAK